MRFNVALSDGKVTGWIVLNGTWSASSKALIKTDNGWGNVAVLSDDADNEIRFDYRFTDISGTDMGQVVPRYLSGDDNLTILIAPGAIILYTTVSGTSTTLDYQTFSTVEDQWYTLRVESDGANVTVWRSTEGELETEVLSTTSAAPTTTDAVLMGIVNETMTNSPFELDNIRILADDLENSTTFAYNTANELTSMTGPNGTTSFTYDAWGRQTAKTLNGVTDAYGYRYGSKLYSVDLADDATPDVVYEYGGNEKRRSRTAGSTYTAYRWEAWNTINEEDSSGNLTLWYLPYMARVSGAPSLGSYEYIHTDALATVRTMSDSNKSTTMIQEFSPFGRTYRISGTDETHAFTSHRKDGLSSLQYYPARFYSPETARWLARDPKGLVDGPNKYAYVRQNPVNYADTYGLDRRVIFGGHACIRVDRYDADGNDIGDVDLHYSPESFDRSDFSTDYSASFCGLTVATVPSTQEEDEELLDMWEDLEDDCPWYLRYNLFPWNCWTVTCGMIDYGRRRQRTEGPLTYTSGIRAIYCNKPPSGGSPPDSGGGGSGGSGGGGSSGGGGATGGW